MLTSVKPKIDELWFREKLMADEQLCHTTPNGVVQFLFLKMNGKIGMMPGLRLMITEDTTVI